MSKASIAFAALLLIPTLGISSTEQVPSKPPMTAQQFVKSYVRAMNRADVGSMMKMFSKSSGVTSVGDGTISHGWHSIQTDAQQFVGREGTFRFTVGSVEVTSLGPSYVLAVAPLTVQTIGQDDNVEVPAAMTFVLQREGGSWKMIHEHWSSKESDDVEGDDQEDEGDGGFDNFDAPGGPPSQDFRSNLTAAPHHAVVGHHVGTPHPGGPCTHGMTCRGARTSGSISTL